MTSDVKSYATGRAGYNRYRQEMVDKGRNPKQYRQWQQGQKQPKSGQDEALRHSQSGRYD